MEKYLTNRSAMPAYASIFVKKINPFRGRFSIPKSFVDSIPPPSYELHPEDPLEVDTVPFGCCIEGDADRAI